MSLSQAFFDFLKEHHVGYVFIEGYYMPHIGEVFAQHDAFTTDFSVIRLHGGDREGIEGRTGQVWNQIVEPQEPSLKATASIIRAGTSRGLMMLVYANNHFEGCAPLTLERLRGLPRCGRGLRCTTHVRNRLFPEESTEATPEDYVHRFPQILTD